LTVPTISEFETEDLIDRFQAFQDRPLSNKVLDTWRHYFKDKEHTDYTNAQVKERLEHHDPNPDELDEKQKQYRRVEEAKPHHSEFILSIMKQVGITSDMDGVIDSTENDKEMESLNGISKTSSRLF